MSPAPVHLSRGGVSLVVGRDEAGIPHVLHWGAALGDLDASTLSALAAAMRPGVSTTGSLLASTAASAARPAGVSVCAVMSGSSAERSRTRPLSSSAAAPEKPPRGTRLGHFKRYSRRAFGIP